MAQPEPTPVPRCWALLLLLLLSGEPVPTDQAGVLNPKSKESPCSQLWQNPRFVARKHGSNVEIRCYANMQDKVEWLWKRQWDEELKPLPTEDRIRRARNDSFFTLTIQSISYQDNGIYYCRQTCPAKGLLHSETLTGCGSELRVMGFSTLDQLRRRNMLKDGIIMIQTLLIILLIVVPIFLLLDKDDGKSGMEEDHTYEGLNIDQTATYEDIVTLRTGEVKWSVGEHPGQE